jgi:hypothetical protein
MFEILDEKTSLVLILNPFRILIGTLFYWNLDGYTNAGVLELG